MGGSRQWRACVQGVFTEVGGEEGGEVNRFSIEAVKFANEARVIPGCEARPPHVHFDVAVGRSFVMTAQPPGVVIHCELLDSGPPASHVVIHTRPPIVALPGANAHLDSEVLADVIVHLGDGNDITKETISIASAIYWSWWRCQWMKGVAPGQEEQKGFLASCKRAVLDGLAVGVAAVAGRKVVK